MNENFAEKVAELLGTPVAEVLAKMSFTLRESDKSDLKAVAEDFNKSVLLTAEALEKANFVAWMAVNYPNVDCTIRKDNQFWTDTPHPLWTGWLGRVAFGGLILDEKALRDYQREVFEVDAKAAGFDITRAPKRTMMQPFDEYVSDETGHRWGGWLARSLNG